ncbi:MAG: HAD family hydrolase [Bacteroidetes bacterium]|nr:MAG: HAD family hydrolase [Bacteroidota bacterium]
MKKYKCIIFDCDGVLVDSETLGNQVMVDMANEHGANIDIAYAMENFKGSFLKDCISQVETIIQKTLPESFEKEYRKRTFDVFKMGLKPVDGIKEVLQKLEIPFCVASSGPKEKIKWNLEITGLIDFFNNNIFSCYDIGKWKPSPAIFLHAATTMGFLPDECLVIEDSVIGVTAAKNGGFDVFGFAMHNEDENFAKTATKQFYHMDELLSMIKLS